MSEADFAIVGLGAIGGSLALDLKAAGARVSGFDIDSDNVACARAAGVDAQLWHERQRLNCDVVIMAVPVRPSLALLPLLAKQPAPRLITDVGSTKRVVIAAAERSGTGERFVGSHPLAGTHESGWQAARAGMFQGRRVFVCATSRSSQAALRSTVELWESVGATTQTISAQDHDAQVAWVSHLPQLTASALALAMKSGAVMRSQLGPGGADMTRLARSNPQMWLDIAAVNADMLDEPLGCLIEALTELRVDLKNGNETGLQKLLQASAAW